MVLGIRLIGNVEVLCLAGMGPSGPSIRPHREMTVCCRAVWTVHSKSYLMEWELSATGLSEKCCIPAAIFDWTCTITAEDLWVCGAIMGESLLCADIHTAVTSTICAHLTAIMRDRITLSGINVELKDTTSTACLCGTWPFCVS